MRMRIENISWYFRAMNNERFFTAIRGARKHKLNTTIVIAFHNYHIIASIIIILNVYITSLTQCCDILDRILNRVSMLVPIFQFNDELRILTKLKHLLYDKQKTIHFQSKICLSKKLFI